MADRLTPKKRVRRSGQHLTDDERAETQLAFLDSFARHANVSLACDAARISRESVYEWREKDEAFAGAWDLAEADASDRLEKEIERRAVTGWQEPVFQGGVEVGRVRKYSDTLLMFLAKKRNPAFRERAAMELTGKDGGAIQHTVTAVNWSDVQAALLSALASYPDARVTVAEALEQLEAAHAVPESSSVESSDESSGRAD